MRKIRLYSWANGILEKGFQHQSLSSVFFGMSHQELKGVESCFEVEKLRISETIGQTSSSLVWGHTDIVYAWNVAALTGPFVEPGDQTAQLYLWA